ncbi:MAG TPA: recombination protein O N-terminal domain-containing protein [Candidatus Paceibacterota bacterium]
MIILMYQIYTTEGFILRTSVFGETDCFYSILTRDFGFIRAEAKGVRKLNGKLRYFLSDFSLVELSLVKGREKWRITSANSNRNIFFELRGDKQAQIFLARVSGLLIRLLNGEEKNGRLFEHVRNAALFLAENRPSGAVLQSLEYLLVLRILYSLGYLGSSPDWSVFTSSALFETGLLMKIEESKRQAIRSINQSLKESHL